MALARSNLSESVRDQRIEQVVPLVAPRALLDELPLTDEHAEVLLGGRRAVQAILDGRDDRLLVVVGFCGSFTTFSSYAFETMSFFEQGQWGLMFANFFSNNLLCLGSALAGMALARAV